MVKVTHKVYRESGVELFKGYDSKSGKFLFAGDNWSHLSFSKDEIAVIGYKLVLIKPTYMENK